MRFSGETRVVLVCGDRNWTDVQKLFANIANEDSGERIDYLVAGGAPGADSMALRTAASLGIQPVECKALWRYHGKAAGPIRNGMQMKLAMRLAQTKRDWAKAAGTDNPLVLAFHSDLENSKGTADMVRRAKKAGLKVKVVK